MFNYKCGIEFEYILLDSHGNILDFLNIDSASFLPIIIASRSKQVDDSLSSGDLGIKSGFWYPEGDERFDSEGNFVDIKIKGMEIRTPVCDSTQGSVSKLLELEKSLSEVLNEHNIYLGIIGFNPVTPKYVFIPELNDWETKMRSEHKEYASADISNLSYGPDINLSSPLWDERTVVDIAQKLNYYSPYMVPFSFSSPFFDNKLWDGYSKRTYERTWRRPAVRVFTENHLDIPLTWQAKNKSEIGRIEFKSFDAILTKELLLALSALALGVALSDLPQRSNAPSKELHRLAAKEALGNDEIYAGATLVFERASEALASSGLHGEYDNLQSLKKMLDSRRTPADDLVAHYEKTHEFITKGGLHI